MAITNGYCTLAEAKQRILHDRSYTASTIAFALTTNIITDTAYGFGAYVVGDVLQVAGSVSNDGYVTISAVTNAGSITVSDTLAAEAAGAAVTITYQSSKQAAVLPINDTLIEDIITAASRWIDHQTGRTWFAATETRKYIVGKDTEDSILYLDKPLLTVTTLTNGDSSVLTAGTEYQLEPVNATGYTTVRLLSSGGKSWTYSTDVHADTVSIAGTWGTASSATANIKEACLLLVGRLWKRKDAVFGVAGTTDLGTITMRIPKDPDVMALLPARNPWGLNY